jgi:plastocyanin
MRMASAASLAAVALVAAAAGVLAGALCGRVHAQQAAAAVTIDQSRFQPDQIMIRRGGTVTWRNRDLVPHTVTFRDADWNSGELAEGGSWMLTIPMTGRWSYYCAYHPDMTGIVTVAD